MTVIDPRYVTNYDRTEAELEEFWLFCLVVAGKTATTQARLLEGFLSLLRDACDLTPFQAIQRAIDDGKLLEYLKYSRLGQFTRLEKAMVQSMAFHGKLKTVQTSELEEITGVGSKTARFFILHTRADQEIAVLDTHVLRYLRDKGLTEQKGTPPKGAKYDALEKVFIAEAKLANMSIADYDLHIWRTYSGNT